MIALRASVLSHPSRKERAKNGHLGSYGPKQREKQIPFGFAQGRLSPR